MKKIDIVIFVEHVARELDIACLLKCFLEEAGLNVKVFSLPFMDIANYWKYDPKVVVTPYCYQYDGAIAQIMKYWPQSRLVNLRFEQIFQQINTNVKAIKDYGFIKEQVVHHAWSPQYAEDLISQGVNPQNIFINGNLSYALYKEPYNKYFDNRKCLAENFGLNPNHRWVFIPENYGAAFYSEQKMKSKIKEGIDPQEVQDYKKFALNSIRQVAHWCLEGAKLNNIEIIFRPRPETRVNDIAEIFHAVCPDLPLQLHILKDGTVKEWILASDIIMSSYSTSLIEAAVASKQIFMLEPFSFPDYLFAEWYHLVERIKTCDEFLAICSGAGHIKGEFGLLQAWAQNRMMNCSDPFRNIVDLLANISNLGYLDYTNIYPLVKGRLFLRHITNIGEKIKRQIKHFIRIIKPGFRQGEIPFDSFDFITIEMVEKKTARWKEILFSF